MEDKRKVLILSENGEWILTIFAELKTGDTFKMVEPDGESVVNDSIDIFTATSDPSYNLDGVMSIEIKE